MKNDEDAFWEDIEKNGFRTNTDKEAYEKVFTIKTWEEAKIAPQLEWLVKGVLPAKGLAAIYGESGSGKSFLELDMAAAISRGDRWFGYRTVKTSVCYVFLEGEAGLSNRINAYTKKHGHSCDDVYFITQPISIVNDVNALGKMIFNTLGRGVLTIIDTLHRASDGLDENTPADMGKIITACTELQHITDGLVLLSHHSGKDISKGLRGHNSLIGALDASIEVLPAPPSDNLCRSWTNKKVKDGESGIKHEFALDIVDIGVDSDGDLVTSCVVLKI